jgi:hypothetical protein
MITETIKRALSENPHIIFPYGAIEPEKLKSGLSKMNYQFPKELFDFWVEFGGGDLFETETILSPIPSDNEFIYDIINTNDFKYKNGLSHKYITFQENASYMAAFDKETNEIVIIAKDNYQEEERFNNFNAWFAYFWKVNQ